MKLTNLLAMLQNVRKSGDGSYMASCVCHQEKTPSLHVSEKNGQILIHCFGCGANAEQTCAALGIQLRDLFPPPPTDKVKQPGRDASKPRAPITLAEFAEAKKLPVDWLKEQGLIDHPDGGVIIGYFDAQGEQAPRQRLRTALRAGDGSTWTGPQGVKLLPYGVWRQNERSDSGRGRE